MRQSSLSFIAVFAFAFQLLSEPAAAQIDFGSLIEQGTQEQNITATEVHRYAGVNADRTPADYNITVESEVSEFNVTLKKLPAHADRRPASAALDGPVKAPAKKKTGTMAKTTGKKKKL